MRRGSGIVRRRLGGTASVRWLALESSCDETALAVWDTEQRRVSYEGVLSQIDVHAFYGGVVPGIAIREHLKGFPILLDEFQKNFDLSTLDALCVTHGPGLIGCLGMGVAYAQSLQLLLKCPLYGVNHLHGHALSPFIEAFEEDKNFTFEAVCPHLGLLISGGNTLLFEMNFEGIPDASGSKGTAQTGIFSQQLTFRIWAQTVDDAAGEALDKGGKLLGFPYPGGPLVERCAQSGDENFVQFPRAFYQTSELKFSFSGLKTSLRYFLEKLPPETIETQKASICASYQAAVTDALICKVRQVLKMKTFKSLGVSGGVSNNQLLRRRLQQAADRRKIPLFMPKRRYCGDNAAMIAFAAPWVASAVQLNPNRTLDEAV